MTCARFETKSCPSTGRPASLSFLTSLRKGRRIKHHAVADDALALRPQHAAGDQLQHELFAVDDDGVPGVVAAGVARDHVELLREDVDDLALALIAPLGTKNDGGLALQRALLIALLLTHVAPEKLGGWECAKRKARAHASFYTVSRGKPMSVPFSQMRALEGQRVRMNFEDGASLEAILLSATEDLDGSQHLIYDPLDSDPTANRTALDSSYYAEGESLVSLEPANVSDPHA